MGLLKMGLGMMNDKLNRDECWNGLILIHSFITDKNNMIFMNAVIEVIRESHS